MTEIVDVIIPYSSEYTEKYKLERAKESAKNQTVDVNLIICEDDVGPAYGRNRGLERSKNRFVAFLDADDYWEEDKLEKQIKKLDETGSGLCLNKVRRGEEIIDPVRESEIEFIKDLLLCNISSLTSSILIDSEKFQNRFDEEMYRFEDHLFIIETVNQSGICFVNEILTTVEKHDNGLSSKTDQYKALNSRSKISKKIGDYYPSLKETAVRDLAQRHRWVGRDFYFNSDYKKSIELYKKSLSIKILPKTIAAYFLGTLKRNLNMKTIF
jgi:glycosyltransferase involved in cell wall biosynthesis